VGVTRWLCKQGAKVTVSDQADESQLAESISALSGLDVAIHLGSHREEDFLDADLLVVNPAFPKDHPLLQKAIAAGVPRTSEINLFLQRCDAAVVGITGSVGKSTTTAMTGEILSKKFTTHVGGNIGRSLLENLPDIQSDHVVVLELSSFQLEDLPLIAVSPHVALITNFMPNHLDRHGTMDAYADAKKNIFRYQNPDDVLILNRSQDATADWAKEAPGKVYRFDPAGEPFELSVPGAHNQANAHAAFAIAVQFGLGRDLAEDALKHFPGLPHRLQFVAEKNGVRYYNDSKCTTPTGAVVALETFQPRRTVILLGGCDKGVSFDELAVAAAGRAKAVVAFGATKNAILESMEKAVPACPVASAPDLPA
ncbi:MAG: UDP-N-acetylmuramoyl-L-alanine--D-glutamate ligase, partial [Candidatus Hydrogenedentes bacterium]|nr:UDP-N-acetylmuramoyl-L-alanine--D-glutamate ligase [Candidatus Hydrogenedentota bacterium]